jgi:hypothetical protein
MRITSPSSLYWGHYSCRPKGLWNFVIKTSRRHSLLRNIRACTFARRAFFVRKRSLLYFEKNTQQHLQLPNLIGIVLRDVMVT